MTPSILDDYDPQGFYCEMLRSAVSEVVRGRVSGLSIDALKERAAAANAEPTISASPSRSTRMRRRSTVFSRSSTLARVEREGIAAFDAEPLEGLQEEL